MKGGYEIVTLGSKEFYRFTTSPMVVDVEEVKRIVSACNSGKPVLIYPNFKTAYDYTTPFFVTVTKSGSRLAELHIGNGEYLIIYSDYRMALSSNPVATTELDIEDPYAMPSMEV